jgi:hypothetical protein
MLGRHDWTTRGEEGESYTVCAVCGKTPPDPPESGPEKHEEPDWENPLAPGGGAP